MWSPRLQSSCAGCRIESQLFVNKGQGTTYSLSDADLREDVLLRRVGGGDLSQISHRGQAKRGLIQMTSVPPGISETAMWTSRMGEKRMDRAVQMTWVAPAVVSMPSSKASGHPHTQRTQLSGVLLSSFTWMVGSPVADRKDV